MQWSQEAEQAVKKVPFFVRKKVRSRVEKEAAEAGKKSVSLADVKRTQARFLSKMSQEVKGFQVDTCFAGGGCPNRVLESESLLEKIERLFKEADILAFLKKNVTGDLKFHHDFRVTLAECPNACSQPQIKDIGIIGAATPLLTDRPALPVTPASKHARTIVLSCRSQQKNRRSIMRPACTVENAQPSAPLAPLLKNKKGSESF